jgi:hypothetical protein
VQCGRYIEVQQGIKAGDIDPRGEREYRYTISDKGRAIGGGVLEAILHSFQELKISPRVAGRPVTTLNE